MTPPPDVKAPRRKRLLLKAFLACAVAATATGAGAVVWGYQHIEQVALSAADPVRPDVVTRAVQRFEAVRLLRKVGAELKARSRTDLEFVQLVTDWVHWNVRPHTMAPGDIISDGPFGALVRGHAYCDQTAAIAAIILWTQGYDVRLLALMDDQGVSPHTVAEVRVQGKWMVFDPWSGAAYSRDGQLQGVHDLDEAFLAHWGVTYFDAKLYQQGRRWRVFPFLTADDLWKRLTTRKGPAIPQPPGLSEARARAVGQLPGRPVRRELVEARLADLSGKDAREAYRTLEPKLAEPDLKGAVQFFTLYETAMQGVPIPARDPEGAWRPSGDALRTRLATPGAPTPVPGSTLARLREDQTPSLLPID